MVVNNTLQLKLFRRKGIQYIQLYTAISREEFFQYMFILYYFIKAMGWGRGGGGQICLFSSSLHFGVCGGGGVGCEYKILPLEDSLSKLSN
jgi:hypothetical protein